jgi:drug/metabolite transporter (DMT)-like permease
MNTTLLVGLVVLVAALVGWVANRRPLSRATVFCAAMAFVGSIAILARGTPPGGAPGTMYYVASFIGPAMGMAVAVTVLRRPWRKA